MSQSASPSKVLGAIIGEYKALKVADIRRKSIRILSSNMMVRPSFSSSWVSLRHAPDCKLEMEYNNETTKIGLYSKASSTESVYNVTPLEYRLDNNLVKIIYLAKQKLVEQIPTDLPLENPAQIRKFTKDAGRRILYSLAKENNVDLGSDREEESAFLDQIAELLAKYTVGMGLLEDLLNDNNIQDIYVDAPSQCNQVYLTLGGLVNPKLYGKAQSNIILDQDEMDGLISRLRYESGRPFSEAMPVLETDMEAFNTRATAIGPPLSPSGTALALRRHSIDPWTLTKFIANETLSELAAGLISFLIDGRSTILFAGSRGAGKSSLMGAAMLEFPMSQRMITIEDTLELPVLKMQEMGFKVQSLYVSSSLSEGGMSAEDALRISLRLGESAIIMGEVRGKETKTLYEAMRAGTAGSSVIGTFHADSARSVYERVVHDMGIPPKSFLATDIIVISGLTRPMGTQKYTRRVTQISEVRGDNDFMDLMVYDEQKDRLVPTDHFKYRSEKIGSIARSWGISLEKAIDNIQTRAAIKKSLVHLSIVKRDPSFLSTVWIRDSNEMFWKLTEKHGIEYGGVLDGFQSWVGDRVHG